MAIPIGIYIAGLALAAYSAKKGRNQSDRQFQQSQDMNLQMQREAQAKAEEFGALAEEQFNNIPTYKTPEEYMKAMDLATGAYESGTSRLATLQSMIEDRAKQPLSGYAEKQLSQGLQQTQQNIAKLSKVGGTRDIYSMVNTLGQQASATGALAEVAMEKKQKELLNFLPQAMQMEQGLSSAYGGAFQMMGAQKAMEFQSEANKEQQLFNMYSSAATGQAAYGQQVGLAGMTNQANYAGASLTASAQQNAAMTNAVSNIMASDGFNEAFDGQ